MAIDIRRKNPLLIERGSPLVATFNENLLPGKTYQVVVKTQSGSVASWPATGNVTTRPLPVQNLRQIVDDETGEISFKWDPHPESHQDSYRVGTFNTFSMCNLFRSKCVSVLCDMCWFDIECNQKFRQMVE